MLIHAEKLRLTRIFHQPSAAAAQAAELPGRTRFALLNRLLKAPQEAGCGVEKRFKMLMVVSVHGAFSVLFAWSSAS